MSEVDTPILDEIQNLMDEIDSLHEDLEREQSLTYRVTQIENRLDELEKAQRRQSKRITRALEEQ